MRLRFSVKRKPALMDGGQDPRELQRRSVEARRRRKQEQASGDADSASFSPGRPRASQRRLPETGLQHTRSIEGVAPQLPETKPSVEPPRRRTTEDVLAEINAAYAANPPAKKPAPPPDDGLTAADRSVLEALKQQAEWRRIQEENGTEEIEFPRLIHPDQYFM
jgi:hypothetical protein